MYLRGLGIGCDFDFDDFDFQHNKDSIRANYSNRGWREKIFENMFFEAERRGKLFQMKVLGAAIDSDKFSSKSELSSRFFGRLKILVIFDSIDSIFFSIRSILSRTTAGDRPAKVATSQ